MHASARPAGRRLARPHVRRRLLDVFPRPPFGARRIPFTWLVPTPDIMTPALLAAVKVCHDTSAVGRLLMLSAPARRDTKRAIPEPFRGCCLFELYGAAEVGWVTMLPPREQLEHLGSLCRECAGSGPIRLLDPEGDEVPDGEFGERYSRTP